MEVAEREVGRDADADVMPDAVPVDVIPPVAVVVGVVIELESDVELPIPVPVADTDVSLTEVDEGPVGAVTVSLVGDARMLEIMLARAVVPALVAEVGDVAEAPAESPKLPGPVTPAVVVARRSEVSPPTSEVKIPPPDEDAEAAVPVGTVTGAVPEALVDPTESVTTGSVAVDVGAVPRAVVTPETTEPRRDVAPGRRPASVEDAAAAVEPPVPVKETPDVTTSGLEVEAGVAGVVAVTTPPGPKVMAPLLEAASEIEVGTEVSTEELVIVG